MINASSISILKSNKKLTRHKKWKLWLEKTAELRDRYRDAEDEDDPLGYNETASVSIMASAAFACGGYALAEYVSQKRNKEDLRYKGHGRDDLYAVIGNEGWVFEYKQFFCSTPNNLCEKLNDKFEEACHCARQTDSLETVGRGVAVLIVYIDEDSESGPPIKYNEVIRHVIKENTAVKFAACLGNNIPGGQCFIMFSDPH